MVAILASAVAVWLVARGEPSPAIHMLIATALGAGFSVLLGTALMTLAFVSADSGHDEAAHRHRPDTNGEDDA